MRACACAGVDAINNILVIGMTNRMDMIDDALLRPGRFEIHMEINLPDEAGRMQIFRIHTSPMLKNKLLGDDVSLEGTLSKRTCARSRARARAPRT